MSVTVHIDSREFKETLAKYRAHTKRTVPEILNKKAYRIAQKAVWFTRKADYAKMAAELGQELKVSGKHRQPTSTRTFKTGLTARWGHYSSPVPLLALIINKRRGAKGLPGLYGAAMAKEFRRVFGAKAKSIGYLRSGWVVAREKLKHFARKGGVLPPLQGGNDFKLDKQFGPAKGGAIPATENRQAVEFWNGSISTKHASTASERRALGFVSEGLRRAFFEEIADMKRFIESELAKVWARI